MFFLQTDSKYKTRAYNSSWRSAQSQFETINEAMRALLSKKRPHRLCFIGEKNSVTTLVLFEGTEYIGTFSQAKIRPLLQIGRGVFIPKILTRKTNIRRKKKKKCEESKLLTELKAYAKSTQ